MHPIAIAHDGVDLSVMGNESVGVSKGPGWEGVCAES